MDTSEVTTTESDNVKLDIKWVINNWHNEKIEPKHAPTGAAAGLLLVCRENPAKFMEQHLKHITASKAEEEANARMSDTGRNVLRTIESLQRFRAKHVPQPAAGSPIEASQTERGNDAAKSA